MVEGVEEVQPGTYPDVLLDRIVIGITGTLPDGTALESFVRRLIEQGVTTGHGHVGGGRAQVDLAVGRLSGRKQGRYAITGRVSLGGVRSIRILPTSKIELNGMRILRAVMGEVPDAGFGGDNLVGPYSSEWPTQFEEQLRLIESAIDDLVAALATAAGASEPLQGRLRLRWVEACRDVEVDDAPDLARRFAATWHGGDRLRQQDYLGSRSTNGVLATTSWQEGSDDAHVMKVYAKSDTLLRTELAVRRAAAVGRLVTGVVDAREADTELDGAALCDLLRWVAVASAPFLDEAWGAVEEVEEAAPGTVSVLTALTPLLAVAAPLQRSGRGRPVSGRAVEAARDALTSLLQIGRVNTAGLRAGGAVRAALDAMAEGDDPVLKREGHRGNLYVLGPKWAPLFRRLAEAARMVAFSDVR